MKYKQLITTVVAVLIVGGAAFYGGMQYQKNQRSTFGPAGNQRLANDNNQNGNGRQNGLGRPVSGEITSMDTGTLTIKTQDGSSKIIVYSSSTKVNKMTEASSSDLEIGEQITAMGSDGTDGTVTAQTISLNSGFQAIPEGNPPTQNE